MDAEGGEGEDPFDDLKDDPDLKELLSIFGPDESDEVPATEVTSEEEPTFKNELPYHPIWNPIGDRYHDEAVSDTFNEETNPMPYSEFFNPTGDRI